MTHRKLLVLCLLVVSGLFAAPRASAAPVCTALTAGSSSVGDVFISSVNADENFESSQSGFTGIGKHDNVNYTLIHIDVSFVPAGATITSATVTLKQTGGTGLGATVDVDQILGGWNPDTVTWDDFTAGFDPDPVATFATGTGSVSFDLTALTQAWAGGKVGNYGILLEQSTGLMTYDFSSAENLQIFNVCYTDAPSPALSLQKTVSTTGTCPGATLITVAPGAQVTSCYAVTNTGDTTVSGVVVNDDGTAVSIGDLAPGASGSGSATAAATATSDTAAVATGTVGGTAVTSAHSDALVTVLTSSLSLVKTVSLGGACPGSSSVLVTSGLPVTYCYAVTNTGGLPLLGVVVSDAGVAVPMGDLAPGASGSGSTTIVVLSNTSSPAVASGTDSTGASVTSPQSSAMVTVTSSLGIDPSCQGSGLSGTFNSAGQENATCASGQGFTLTEAVAFCGANVNYFDYTCTDFAGGTRAWTAVFGCCVPAGGPSCSDGIQNGTESDVDCGGQCPVACVTGQKCNGPTDCITDYCVGGHCAVPSVLSSTCTSDGNNVTLYSDGFPEHQDGTCEGGFEGFTIFEAAANCPSGQVKYFDYTCTDFALPPPYQPQRTWESDYACCEAVTPPCVSDASCDDGDACTIDTCDPAVGCVHTPLSCDDGDACTTDTCDPAVGCVYASISCDDGDACTADSCDHATGCVHAAVSCDDGDACTVDACDPAVGCHHAAVSCDDGSACTADSCDPATGCVNVAISCDDGDACTADSCNPATGCFHAAVSCDDGNACTADSCNPATGCVHTSVSCDDGNACTADSCNPATGCAHAAVSCDDGNACTTDSCDPASGCVHAAVSCDDQNPCTDDTCNPATGCVHTSNDANSCSDGNLCNGLETCQAGVCVPGQPFVCSCGDACTVSSCDPVHGCVHTPITPCSCGLVVGTPAAGPAPPPPPPPPGQPPPPPPPPTGPNQVSVSVQDSAASAAVMDQVQINWPCTNGALTQVKLDGAVVWQGSLACAGAAVTITPTTAGWTTNAGNETINAGQTRQLLFQFQNNVDTNVADYSWNVDFGGCPVINNGSQSSPTCPSLPVCTPAYPFTSSNPLTSLVFSESDVLADAVWGFAAGGCAPTQIRVFYNDEHALSLGVRQVVVKTASGTTTTNYPIAPTPSGPSSVLNPAVGSTIGGGDQAGADVSGRPLFPALFITDTTANPNSLAGDWQNGGVAVPPTAVFGVWKGAVRTVDYTHTPAAVTVTPDADPPKNDWNLGAGADPVPAGLGDEGYGAEVRWDLSQLNLLPGHSYRFYFMVHDGDQNKTGGDAGQACETLCLDESGDICGSGANVGIQKSAPATLSSEGTSLPYTVTVTSNGTQTAPAVVMTDAMPAGVAFDSVTTTLGTCGFANGTVTCGLGDMAPNTTANITILTTPVASGSVTNTATVTTTTPETNTADNTASATTTFFACNLVAGTPTVATNQVKVPVQDGEASAVVVDEVQIQWPCTNGALTQVKLDGAVVWQGSLACTGAAATITPTTAGWTTNAANETISAGQTRQLTFQFQSPADTNVADYSWNVDFGGCTVTNNWGQPGPTCPSLPVCTPSYPFTSSNPLTSIVFSESDVLEDAVWGFTQGCAPTQIRVFYSDEHALSLGVRQVNVKTASGTTTTTYPIAPLPQSPGNVLNPAVGSTIQGGDQSGVDVSGRPMFPALFITDTTVDPNNLAGDWQYGGAAVPPTAVFGAWKGAVKTVDHTHTPAAITVTPDTDPARNNWSLGAGADPVPAGLANQGYGAEIRWDLSQLNLVPGHSYRFYFMVHDGDQNKVGGDVGQACESLCLDADGNICGSSGSSSSSSSSSSSGCSSGSSSSGGGSGSTCPSLPVCTTPYPFASANPLTGVVFSESEDLEAATVGFGGVCAPTQIRVFYSDEHALSLGVRQVNVKTASGTTTTTYPIAPTPASPGSVLDPAVGSTISSGDQAGVDVSGRPLFPALFMTDVTGNPTSLAGDWQYGGVAIPPTAVFGTWKGAVRMVDYTHTPAAVTVTTDVDPPRNNWTLGTSADPVPPGLANEGYGAEVRWDLSQLNLLPGHTYRFYFMVHDGDQNKVGGDVGQGCQILCIGADGNLCSN